VTSTVVAAQDDPVTTITDSETTNGAATRCEGCGTTITAGRKWCSEQCRNRHRVRDKTSVDPAESWTFPTVVAELVDAGLVVSVNIEGLELRLSASTMEEEQP
jgi:hypothetical protein